MHLEQLYITRTKISDISILKDMPLERLDMNGTKVTNFSVLKGMPLKRIHLPSHAKGIDFLRSMSSLVSINNQPAAQFWKEYDAAQAAKAKGDE